MESNKLILGKNSPTLSKAQKRFNSLLKSMEKLKVDAILYDKCIEKGRELEMALIVPSQKKHEELRVQYLFLLDSRMSEVKLKKRVHIGLSMYIAREAYELINEGYEELIPLHDKHSDDGDYEEEKESANDFAGEMIKTILEMELGEEITEDIDWTNEEEVMEFLHKKHAELEDKEFEKMQEQGQKKQTKKPTKAQAKREEEETLMKKSARAIYLELVKAYHPDKEQDELEKERKSEIMKKITAAYEANDLMELLRLQLEMEDVSADKLDSIAEDKLLYINKLLSRQVAELRNDTKQKEHVLRNVLGGFRGAVTVKAIESQIKKTQKKIKKSTIDLDSMMQDVRYNAAIFKQFAAEIAEEMEEDDFDFDFGFPFL